LAAIEFYCFQNKLRCSLIDNFICISSGNVESVGAINYIEKDNLLTTMKILLSN